VRYGRGDPHAPYDYSIGVALAGRPSSGGLNCRRGLAFLSCCAKAAGKVTREMRRRSARRGSGSFMDGSENQDGGR
jgi:hypothetical protein